MSIPCVYIWYLSNDKVNPIKDRYLDVMYGQTLKSRYEIKLPVTEVEAHWNDMLEGWDFRYGAGWQDNFYYPLELNPNWIWY